MQLGRDEGGWGLSVYLVGVDRFTYFVPFVLFKFFFHPRYFNSFSNIEELTFQGEKKSVKCPKAFLVILCSADLPFN